MGNIDHPAARMGQIPFSGIREIFEKCDELENAGVDVVHLEIGRPDFDTPSPIKEAAKQALADGHVHYTSNYGIKPLREAIASKLSAENGIEYDPSSEVIVTTGATEAVLITMLAFIEPESEVLVPDPGWTYEPITRLAGGEPVSYELDPKTGFQPDIASLQAKVTNKTRLLVLNSPHNPTGGVVTEDCLDEIAEFVLNNDLLLLSDEIYEKIRFEDYDHHSPAARQELFERTITVNGLSKAYSMTGWRLGYLAAPQDLVDPLIRARQYTTTCSPSISQYAGIRALQSGLYEPMVEAFARRRDRVLERIDEIPGISCPAPAGAFYAFPTIPSECSDAESFVNTLLEEKGVAFVPGTVFGESGQGRFRIAYANSLDRIDEAFNRLESWL